MVRTTPIKAEDAPVREKTTNYPEPFASLMAGRLKRQLGDVFGLSNFGVNLTVLKPGARSALHHAHTRQDEFIYIIAGAPTLFFGHETHVLGPGDVFGFVAGGPAHHLENATDEDVVVLEIGDRLPGDTASYPNDDLAAVQTPEGKWAFTHKDGTPYPASKD